jgi:hypothetical protein
LDTTPLLKDPIDSEPITYRVETAQGSVFFMLYKPTMIVEYENISLEQGDMLLQGYSEVAKRYVNLAGIGIKPEIGSSLTVRPIPADHDGDFSTYNELITQLKELTDE